MHTALRRSFGVLALSLALPRAAFAEDSGPGRVIVVTVSANTPELDGARLRAAVGSELHLEAVGPEDARAAGATGHLDVALDRSAHELVVTYEGGAELLVRRVDWPADPDATTRVVTMLAGNLGRDEAGELADSLRTQTQADPSDAPAPERHEREVDAATPALRLALNRIELRPHAGWAINPSSVTGAFIGADLAYRMSRFFAMDADVAWYAAFNGSPGASPWYPLAETQWSGDLDAYVFPWPAHARKSGAWGAFEPFVLGGVGLLTSRPIAVVDPALRHFDYRTNVDLAVGLGARVFLSDQTAITLEVRDLMYFQKLEAMSVAAGSTSLPLDSPNNPANPMTWYSQNPNFTNSVQVRLGVSFFVP